MSVQVIVRRNETRGGKTLHTTREQIRPYHTVTVFSSFKVGAQSSFDIFFAPLKSIYVFSRPIYKTITIAEYF